MTAPTHTWVPDYCMGDIAVCSECPEIWWQWRGDTEPRNECSMNWRRFTLNPWEKAA